MINMIDLRFSRVRFLLSFETVEKEALDGVGCHCARLIFLITCVHFGIPASGVNLGSSGLVQLRLMNNSTRDLNFIARPTTTLHLNAVLFYQF